MEKMNPVNIPDDADKDFLEPYYKKPFFSGKFWRWVAMLVAMIAAVYFFKKGVIDASMTSQELQNSIRLVDLASQWVVKESVPKGENQGLIVVPEVSFRISNVGQQGLHYVYFVAVFRWAENGKSIGEGFMMTLRQKLHPGKESGRIVLRAPFGYRVNSLDSFVENPKMWKDAFVEIFAHSKNSGTIQLKELPIARKIAGTNIDVRLEKPVQN